MRSYRSSISFITAIVIISINSFSQTVNKEPATLKPGSNAPDFNLLGTDGNYYSLKDFESAKVLVVIFSCNHCPTAQAYEDRIIAVSDEYRQKGVALVMISPNSPKALNYSELGYSDMGDSFDEMKVRAKEKRFTFPYLYDGDEQKCALAYGPVATPHCFVFDSNRILRYTGRVDGNEKPGTGKGEDLRNAIDTVLAGLMVKTQVTKVFGCSIKWSWKTEYTEKLYKQWSELPVSLDDIDETGVKELIKNSASGKVRLINFWATWCGPCITEFPDLVIIDRMYRGRDFEFITVSTDKKDRKDEALGFLKKQEASNKNYIFSNDDVYRLIETVGNNWQGALPFTLLIEPGGKILFSRQDMIDPYEIKKLIVDSRFIGRYY